MAARIGYNLNLFEKLTKSSVPLTTKDIAEPVGGDPAILGTCAQVNLFVLSPSLCMDDASLCIFDSRLKGDKSASSSIWPLCT